mgnify:FL=1|jgi:hypothetical protein
MNKMIIAIIALVSSGCVVHAHTPAHNHPVPPRAVHKAPAHPHPHTVRPAHPTPIKAWVWVKGHATPGGYVHGYWDLRTVPRHMINRNPHTYVRHVKGRGRPTPPARRYR